MDLFSGVTSVDDLECSAAFLYNTFYKHRFTNAVKCIVRLQEEVGMSLGRSRTRLVQGTLAYQGRLRIYTVYMTHASRNIVDIAIKFSNAINTTLYYYTVLH